MATKKVFISYTHADVAAVEPVEATLKDNGVSVWRDQKSIYAGEKWPKVLGEAISSNDVVLLVWSKRAATSEFVELEWCIAVALKKTIIPYRLDQTPLPSSLKAIHSIDADKTGASDQILESLQTKFSDADTGRAIDVLKALDDIPEGDPKKIVGTAKSILAQNSWIVKGDVYQAAGDIHIHHAIVEPQKRVLEKWQTWVAVVVGVLTAGTLLKELVFDSEFDIMPDSAPVSASSRSTNTDRAASTAATVTQELAGIIVDESDNPIPGVKVVLIGSSHSTVTQAHGRFSIPVEGAPNDLVRLSVTLDGYRPLSDYYPVRQDIHIVLRKR